MLEAAIKRQHFSQSALIEILHTAQQLFGCLNTDLLYFVARQLKLPPSKVYGVATFYHFFTFKPRGQHTCIICRGTACYVKGADQLVAVVEAQTAARMGETTVDGKVSLLSARCLGACGIAPAAVLDDVVQGHLTPDSLLKQIKGWL
jgi:bidirectional [NiFe] hydrogenase diaphorase subunit